MAKKDWEIAYEKTKGGGITPIYRNRKTHQYIQIGGKQLGSFDNFQTEKYPFLVENSGYAVKYEKWFSQKEDAIEYLKEYMEEN